MKLSILAWREIEHAIEDAVKLAQNGYIESEQEYFEYLSEQEITNE